MSALRIGFLGLGNMGMPMTRRILAAGLPTIVWNRSAERAEAAGALGAETVAFPRALMSRVDVACLCMTDGAAVESVVFGKQGLLSCKANAGPGQKYIVDFSSIDPGLTVTLANRAHRAGVCWVDAPVSGGVPGAQSGNLIVFAGGKATAIEFLQPLFRAVAVKVTHMGPSGAGQATKICNQMIVACNLMVLAETYAAAGRAGMDTTRLASALAGGFADSLPLQVFGPRMAEHRFAPTLCAIRLMAKDLELAGGMVSAGQSFAPISAQCAELYRTVKRHTAVGPNDDLSALVRLFEQPDLPTS